MAVTPNFSWPTPDDSDAVSQGAAAIRSLGTAVDATVYAQGTAITGLGTAIAGVDSDLTVLEGTVTANGTAITGLQSDLSSLTTTDVSEGTNLYYTDGRADGRIAAADLEDLNNVSGSPGDGQVLTYDTGTSLWGPADASGGAAGLVAVKHALLTTPVSFGSVSSGDSRAISALSITHAMSNASNKLIISAYFGAAIGSNQRGQLGLGIKDGGSFIGIGDAAGARVSSGAANGYIRAQDVRQYQPVSQVFVYSPGDTASHTYTVHCINSRNNTQTLYINRMISDVSSAERPRTASALVIQEVSV